MVTVDFYFDYSCPWSYLAFIRLREATMRTGSAIRYCPVRVEQILQRANPDNPVGREPSSPRKLEYAARDLETWADYVGVRLERPEDWPTDPARAAAALIAADQQGLAAEWSDAVFAAYFGLGRDIADPQVLGELADTVGLDPTALDANPATDVIVGHEDRLLEQGGFGTPTMIIEDVLLFGNDRMPLVEFTLGQRSDMTFVMPGQHG